MFIFSDRMNRRINVLKHNMLYSLLATILILIPSFLCGRTVHLVMLGDTKAQDIQISVLRDLKNIKKSLKYLSKCSETPIQVTLLSTKENSLTTAHVSHWLKKVEIDESDVVVIYYSGHGFRTTGSRTTIPFGDLPPYNKKEGSRLDLCYLTKLLIKRKAGLNIVLLDCCNGFYPEKKGLIVIATKIVKMMFIIFFV